MWRISSRLTGKCCYRDQKITYCNSVRANICEIYRKGKKVLSGYIGTDTRIIYRSDSSRLIFLIQMSAEMWHFDEQGNIIFHKMMNSFFPEIFKRWRKQDCNHVVTIILFTRVDVSGDDKVRKHGETVGNPRDYFRVVVDQVDINNWEEIMTTLRYEFSRFDRDILLQSTGKIVGKIAPAIKGNILEAISIATKLVSGKFRDRDLRRTGTQALLVTPGTGLFDVDYNAMYQTSTLLTNLEIGIDIVCLSRQPLHITPLFRFIDEKTRKVSHCVPSWLDISFWAANQNTDSQWIPRCKIYEIQMMGVMENESSSIAIEFLPESTNETFAEMAMDQYDENVFNPGIHVDEVKPYTTEAPNIISNPQPSQIGVVLPSSEVQAVVKPSETQAIIPPSNFQTKAQAIVESSEIDVQKTSVVANSFGPFSPANSSRSSQTSETRLNSLSDSTHSKDSYSSGSKPRSAAEALSDQLAKQSKPKSGISSLFSSPLLRGLSTRESLDDDSKSIKEKPSSLYGISAKKSSSTLRTFKTDLDSDEKGSVNTSKSSSREPSTKDTSSTRGINNNIPLDSDFQSHNASLEVANAGNSRANLSTQTSISSLNDSRSNHSTRNNLFANALSNIPIQGLQSMFNNLHVDDSSDNEHKYHPKTDSSASSALSPITPIQPSKQSNQTSTTTPLKSIPITNNNTQKKKNTDYEPLSDIIPGKSGWSNYSDISSHIAKNHLDRQRSISLQVNTHNKPDTPSKEQKYSTIGPSSRAEPTEKNSKQGENSGQAELSTTELNKEDSDYSQLPKELLEISQYLLPSNDKHGHGKMQQDLRKVKQDNTTISREVEEHSMWMTIENPSNVPQDKIIDISNYGRWQFVYPKMIKRRTVKWRSMISPAALPLLTFNFPSDSQLQYDFTNQDYLVLLKPESAEYNSLTEVFNEMIAVRIALGFQIVSKYVIAATREGEFDAKFTIETEQKEDAIGKCIYMAMGSLAQRLELKNENSVEVQIAKKKDLTTEHISAITPNVKTRYEDRYSPITVKLLNEISTLNWNQMDQILTGNGEDVTNDPRTYRMRYVLIPVDVPQAPGLRPFGDTTQDTLNAEEMRLDGLRKLTAMLHKGRYYTLKEKKALVRSDRPPDITFYTGSLENFLSTTYDPAIHGKQDPLIFKPTERFTRDIKLSQLAEELQSPTGVKFENRRWHWKRHYHCFVGHDLATWLQDNFRDILNVEEAVEYGNHLMKNGLFHHVDNRHMFLDGHYFYQLAAQYADNDHDPSSRLWFQAPSQRPKSSATDSSSLGSNQKGGVSSSHSPSTPSAKGSSGAPHHYRQRSGSIKDTILQSPSLSGQSRNTSLSHITKDNNSIAGRNSSSCQKKKVELTRSMKYNVDPTKKSSRPEILTIHFDRVHNPEHCFQLRLEWLNTTPKLIDDAVVNIARYTEPYGLKLVQIPLNEITKLPETNPFCSLFRCKLIIDPLDILRNRNQKNFGQISSLTRDRENSNTSVMDSQVSLIDYMTDDKNDKVDALSRYNIIEKALNDDPLYYHKFILRYCDYYHDTGPISSTITDRMDVEFSWGKPTYKDFQFVHKSGLCIAQVSNGGDYTLMINSLAVNRIEAFEQRFPREYTYGASRNSKPEALLNKFRELCQDEERLIQLFEKATQAWITEERPSSSSSSDAYQDKQQA